MLTDARQPSPLSPALDPAPARTRARHDRLSRAYDRMERRMEARRLRPWRELLWSLARG